MPEMFFWLFAALALFSALGVVFSHQPMMSGCWMFALILGIAGVMASLQAWMLALLTVLVYAGAILVLFLFVIMFVGQKPSSKQIGRLRLLGALLAVVCILLLIAPLQQMATHPEYFGAENSLGNSQAYGMLLFTRYCLPTQLAGWMLLWVGVGVMKTLERPKKEALLS